MNISILIRILFSVMIISDAYNKNQSARSLSLSKSNSAWQLIKKLSQKWDNIHIKSQHCNLMTVNKNNYVVSQKSIRVKMYTNYNLQRQKKARVTRWTTKHFQRYGLLVLSSVLCIWYYHYTQEDCTGNYYMNYSNFFLFFLRVSLLLYIRYRNNFGKKISLNFDI